jgi:hypothetical protein
MNKFTELEYKFAEQIESHIVKALPQLYGNFVEFRKATEEEDCRFSYDMVFGMNFTISIRIRKYKYTKFADLTIRSKSKFGGKTEIDKIMDGMAQVYFYSYMNEAETDLVKVRIADVEAIRTLYNNGKYTGPRRNFDGTELIAFSFKNIASVGGAIYKYDYL